MDVAGQGAKRRRICRPGTFRQGCSSAYDACVKFPGKLADARAHCRNKPWRGVEKGGARILQRVFGSKAGTSLVSQVQGEKMPPEISEREARRVFILKV